MNTYATQPGAIAAINRGELREGDTFLIGDAQYRMVDDVWMTQDLRPEDLAWYTPEEIGMDTPNPRTRIDWADEQDEIAYDTFKTLARDRDVDHAASVMKNVQRMGASFADFDIEAWVDRFNDEEM